MFEHGWKFQPPKGIAGRWKCYGDLDGTNYCMLVSNHVLFLPRRHVGRVKERVSKNWEQKDLLCLICQMTRNVCHQYMIIILCIPWHMQIQYPKTPLFYESWGKKRIRPIFWSLIPLVQNQKQPHWTTPIAPSYHTIHCIFHHGIATVISDPAMSPKVACLSGFLPTIRTWV